MCQPLLYTRRLWRLLGLEADTIMHRLRLLFALFPAAYASAALAQPLPADPEFDAILASDLAELTVTSVSKTAQKLNDAPAAVYVITQEDLRRTGVTTIPDALRMVPGLQVAQAASNRWAVSARGFNGVFSNKLLVMMDGRSIYTPIFSGTYWDDQSTLIADIERIEVVRGPGASVWGANAVNGIINIITKHASETQGNYLAARAGNEEGGVDARHGGKLSEKAYYRAYAQVADFDATKTRLKRDNVDDWNRVRTGFRIDGETQQADTYTVQGDVYGGEQTNRTSIFTATPPYSARTSADDASAGGNILGRWNRNFSATSGVSVQAYIDHYARFETVANQRVTTLDLDMQHHFQLSERNEFLWGAGYRHIMQELDGTFAASATEEFRSIDTFSAFAQDRFAIAPDKLYLTLGSKFEHNDFTGFEVQPNARISWLPTQNQTLWASVSRAVRIPSSIENDVSLVGSVTPGTPPGVLRVLGTSATDSEELIAYEVGYRIQPVKTLSLDLTAYVQDYDKLLTLEGPGGGYIAADGTFVIPYVADNLGEGKVYGTEAAVSWNVTPNWRLMGAYTLTKMDLETDASSTSNLEPGELQAPRHQFSIRSYYNITPSIQWDNMLYYVDDLADPIEQYLRYDTRLAYQMMPGVEVSVIGRNLLDPKHPEFVYGNPISQVERSFLGMVTWKF